MNLCYYSNTLVFCFMVYYIIKLLNNLNSTICLYFEKKLIVFIYKVAFSFLVLINYTKFHKGSRKEGVQKLNLNHIKICFIVTVWIFLSFIHFFNLKKNYIDFRFELSEIILFYRTRLNYRMLPLGYFLGLTDPS